jgi:hypothetical protein
VRPAFSFYYKEFAPLATGVAVIDLVLADWNRPASRVSLQGARKIPCDLHFLFYCSKKCVACQGYVSIRGRQKKIQA